MNRPLRLFALGALAIAITACSEAAGSLGDAPSAPPTSVPSVVQASQAPKATATAVAPTASPIETPSPTEPVVDPATVLAANGIGPYVVGAQLSELQSEGLIANVEPSFHCDDEWESGNATGRYADQLTATFYFGRMVDVRTASAELVTPSGARVSMSLTELRSIYGSRGTLITGTSGNQALSVRVPDTDLGIVFYLYEAVTRSLWMSAGRVERLEMTAVVGEGC